MNCLDCVNQDGGLRVSPSEARRKRDAELRSMIAAGVGLPRWAARRVTSAMDDIDARIVAALIRDARASYAVVGNEVGLSAPAVKRRVGRLTAAGGVPGF